MNVRNLLLVTALATASAVTLSCSVNEYCLNCAVNGDGGHGDGNDGGDDGGTHDAPDSGPCTPTNGGIEVCDSLDNDCNGTADDNISGLGALCSNQQGECAGGVTTCTNGVLGCSKSPVAEICDLKDNNCNGTADDNDPGGGGTCGTNLGECTAGTNHCVGGQVVCMGAMGAPNAVPESCNGKDDDCDGNFDEGLTNLGSCGGPNVGTCHTGTLVCQGGGEVCMNDQGPTFETCDNTDNDCDTKTDEGFNKLTDPRNCMTCGHVCSAPHAISNCTGGTCGIASCAAGYHDNNPAIPGCEYGPCQPDGAEVCDGIDNDCDGMIDNGLTAPAICKSGGECGLVAPTATCQGAAGWKCTYPGTVSTDAMGNIIPETKCDTKDNDCDTKIDENQPNLLQNCADTGIGACQKTGKFQCGVGAAADGPAVCVFTNMGSNTPEKCDGIDNNCNGTVDEGANLGTLPGQEYVSLPAPSTTKIMKYEAARQNASATDQGTTTQFACSQAGVIPWTNVTYPQAKQACIDSGARLCTEAEWQSMCEGPTTYPVSAVTLATNEHVVIQAELAQVNFTNTAGTPHTWTADTGVAGYTGTTAMRALANSGTTVNNTNAPTQSARLDFTVDFGATAADYTVWVRATGTDNSSNSVWTAVNTTAPGTVTANGQVNLANNSTYGWFKASEQYNVSGIKTVSVYMREDGAYVDAISISRDNLNPPNPTTSSIWSYQNNKFSAQPQVCNDNPFDADLPPATTGDQDDILPAGSLAACFANGVGTDDAYDMSGNVKEWTNARAVGQNPIRGGASNNEVGGTTCELNFTLGDDDFFFPNVGFRCCK